VGAVDTVGVAESIAGVVDRLSPDDGNRRDFSSLMRGTTFSIWFGPSQIVLIFDDFSNEARGSRVSLYTGRVTHLITRVLYFYGSMISVNI
jgi:hypothetical protein